MLTEPLRNIVYRLSRIFQAICAKIWNPADLPGLKEEVAITLVLMETHLPPAFFDNMTHLLLHLVEELGMCGPVHCRWMYPIERYLGKLKKYVRNRARPEGCMAECFRQDEAVGLASEYMANFHPVSTRIWDAEEDEGVAGEVLQGAFQHFTLSTQLRDKAHEYILKNMECFQPLLRRWDEAVDNDEHEESQFPTWMKDRLDYGLGNDNPVLFQGRWVQSGPAGLKVDRDGFLLANFHRMIPEVLDPFIFPSQVEQIFFMPVNLRDPDGWVLVLHKTPRARRVYFDPGAVTSDGEASEDIPVDTSPLATECYATLADYEEELEEELDHDEEQDNEQDMEEFRNEISDDDEDGQDTCNQ
ncbi:hypothetical protein R1sor_021766 [Riccia sorocarpa]|uniref:DUF4218 domain-containing protein n=1 Tax=Riccia sorocarpa TaxID=122646 RepID=A0ABD3GHY6_9MARC